MRQHGPSFIGDVQDISVPFKTLLIFEGCIRLFTILFMIVFILNEMDNYVFDSVSCFCIEEIKGIVGSGKMAIHTICNEPLGIIDMC